MPVSADEMTKAQAIPMREVLETTGVTKKKLAETILDGLNALKLQQPKGKGFILSHDDEKPLPDGWKAAVKTTEETIFERESPDIPERLKAAGLAAKLAGYNPVSEHKVTHELGELLTESLDELGEEPDVKLPSQEKDE